MQNAPDVSRYISLLVCLVLPCDSFTPAKYKPCGYYHHPCHSDQGIKKSGGLKQNPIREGGYSWPRSHGKDLRRNSRRKRGRYTRLAVQAKGILRIRGKISPTAQGWRIRSREPNLPRLPLPLSSFPVSSSQHRAYCQCSPRSAAGGWCDRYTPHPRHRAHRHTSAMR